MFVKACTLSVMAKTNKHTRQANVHLFVGFCGNLADSSVSADGKCV